MALGGGKAAGVPSLIIALKLSRIFYTSYGISTFFFTFYSLGFTMSANPTPSPSSSVFMNTFSFTNKMLGTLFLLSPSSLRD